MPTNVNTQTLPVANYASKWRTLPAPVIPNGAVQTFKLQNTEISSSVGFSRIGIPFAKGQLPKLSVPAIKRGGVSIEAQFDERSTWEDGSLRFCVCSIRDSDFSSSEERTYTVEAELAEYDNTSTKSIADITGSTDFNIELTGVQNSSAGVHNGGTLTASFNTHSATATRVTKIHSGAICDTYLVWGMFNGSSEDAHLKANWLVTAWKNANGDIIDYEFGATLAQDWHGVSGKDRLDYNCALKDATTTVESFTGVQHVYHSQWFTIDTTDAPSRYGKRRWKNNAPTLHYKPDRTYWIESGLIEPYDLNLETDALNATTQYDAPYVPCQNLDHRANIDGTGGYMARGILPNCDILALLSQDAVRARHARVNAFAGLHVIYHHRDHRTRARPGEGNDLANTIMSMRLNPKPQSYWDFTSRGMPAATLVSRNPVSASPDDLVDFTEPSGGRGVWVTTTDDASHAVNYSYFMYLLEGERYFMEATLDLATNISIQKPTGPYGSTAPLFYALDAYRQPLFNIPTDQWSQIADMNHWQNHRAAGWSLNILSSAHTVVPDNDVQAHSIRAYVENNIDWVKQTIDYLPQDQKDLGIFLYNPTIESPWMQDFICLGALAAHRRINNADSLILANHVSKWPMYQWGDPLIYMANQYRMSITTKKGDWHQTENPFRSEPFGSSISVNSNSSNNTFTVQAWNYNMYLQENDPVIFVTRTENAAVSTIPTGFTEGTIYYAKNVSGFTLELATTPGGATLNVSDDATFVMEARPSVGSTTPAVYAAPYLPNPDSEASIHLATLISAHYHDSVQNPQDKINEATAWLINRADDDYMAWRYKEGQV